MGIAEDLILIVLAGLFTGSIAQALKQPLVVGYILAGVLLGPNITGVTVSDVHDIELLAEVGVALLLFALGIEFSLKDLRAVGKVALIGAPIQILLTIGFGHMLGLAFGWSHIRAIWFGGLISLSSTMVVLKTLATRELLGTVAGRVMIGMLIVQDLAVIPLMILLPQISTPGVGLADVGWALARAGLLLALIYIAGVYLVPRLMHYIAGWKSRELFMLSTIALALGIGYLTHHFGLSFAFGAFVAGMVLSESDYGHQALSEVLSLRDLFGLVFFTSVGMLLDPRVLVENYAEVLATVALVMGGKAVIFYGIARVFGYGNIAPLAIGLGLSQMGEFAFLLAQVGLSTQSIDRELFSLTISTAIVTMLLTPYAMALAQPLYRLQKRLFPGPLKTNITIEPIGMREHTIIIGGGRVGHRVAAALQTYNIPFVVTEFDQRRVDQAKKSGFPIIFGDATQSIVLEAANLEHAKLVVVTVPIAGVARDIVNRIRSLRPDLHLIVRSETIEEMDVLQSLGVHDVVQPELEAAREVIRRCLWVWNIHVEEPAVATNVPA